MTEEKAPDVSKPVSKPKAKKARAKGPTTAQRISALERRLARLEGDDKSLPDGPSSPEAEAVDNTPEGFDRTGAPIVPEADEAAEFDRSGAPVA